MQWLCSLLLVWWRMASPCAMACARRRRGRWLVCAIATCNDYQSQHIVRQRVQGSYEILFTRIFTRANDGRLRLYQARPNMEAPFEDRG